MSLAVIRLWRQGRFSVSAPSDYRNFRIADYLQPVRFGGRYPHGLGEWSMILKARLSAAAIVT